MAKSQRLIEQSPDKLSKASPDSDINTETTSADHQSRIRDFEVSARLALQVLTCDPNSITPSEFKELQRRTLVALCKSLRIELPRQPRAPKKRVLKTGRKVKDTLRKSMKPTKSAVDAPIMSRYRAESGH